MKKTTPHARRPLTKADFDWVTWTEKDIEQQADFILDAKRAIHTKIKAIPHKDRTFENTMLPLDQTEAYFEYISSKIGILGKTSPNENIQKIARAAKNKISQEIVDIEYDQTMYEAIREYANRAKGLAEDQKKLLKDTIIGYKRMGFDLPLDKQRTLKSNLKKIKTLGHIFANNIDDDIRCITVTKKELKGMDENYIASLEKSSDDRYKITLSYPHYTPFMEYAESDKARERLSELNAKRGGVKNIVVLKKILALRYENAVLLGYKNYIDYNLENRMAKNQEIASHFLQDLVNKIQPSFKKEFKEIVEFKNKNINKKTNTIKPSDLAYYARLLKEQQLSFDENAIRDYFPLGDVMKGVFSLFGTVFNLSFEKKSLPSVHPDVQWYAVLKNKSLLGYLGLDLFPRPKKYSHICASLVRPPSLINTKEYQAPVVMMIGNFTKPTTTSPSLLSHREMRTFIHELGHLTHLLSNNTRYAAQCGFGVKWDFVETPSQLFENWMWEKKFLKKLSGHYKTGAQVPDELIIKLQQGRHFREASAQMRQLDFALLDLEFHSKKNPGNPIIIANKLRKKLENIITPKSSLFPANFGHLIGYGAGYYSYMWSLALADDIWTRFENEGITNQIVGEDLFEKILSKGASEEESTLVKNFLGRKPNNKAFLKRFR